MKILIADDHALFRDGLSMQLEQINPNVTIFQAANYTQAIKVLNDEKKLDLIILDLDMPDMGWEVGFNEIKKISNGSRFVIISASEDNRNIRKALENGISGYIPKRSETKVLTGALKLILDGGTYLPPSVLDNTSHKSSSNDNTQGRGSNKMLTNRQAQVLDLVAQGMSNKQIAYEIGVSEATVKLHINALLRSVGATNRTQAVVKAQKMGLI